MMRFFLAALVLVTGMPGLAPLARAQTAAAIHLVDDLGNHADDALADSGLFVTDFKGIGDVTITQLAGGVEGSFLDDFDGITPANNPSYIRGFIGNANDGTGDGTAGSLEFLHSDANADSFNSWQFDFATPLTVSDRLVFTDVDLDEQYQVQAFARQLDGSYRPLDLGGWRSLNFTGQTEALPDVRWAQWTPANGTLTATGADLEEPLNVLAPDQSVDRLIVTKLAGAGASAGFQILALPTSYVPVVTLAVAKPSVVNGSGDFAQYTLFIDEPPTANVFVNYTVKGSALNGTDYVFLKGVKKIKPGKASKPIKVFPLGNLEGADKKVVKLTLAPGDGYAVSTTGPLKVKILAGR